MVGLETVALILSWPSTGKLVIQNCSLPVAGPPLSGLCDTYTQRAGITAHLCSLNPLFRCHLITQLLFWEEELTATATRICI